MNPGRFREKILAFMQVCEPYSASEIARGVETTALTVLRDLRELHAKDPSLIGYKKVGRTNLYWRKKD